MLIVRDLLIAPRRFSELERRLKGMGTNLLTKRLKDLRAAGMVSQDQARMPFYTLTEMGQSLEPLVLELARWGMGWAGSSGDKDATHFPDWDLLALKALFVPDPDKKRAITATFVDGSWTGWVHIDSKAYTFGIGEPPFRADVEFGCAIHALRDGGAVISSLHSHQKKSGSAFLSCFPLAPKSPDIV